MAPVASVAAPLLALSAVVSLTVLVLVWPTRERRGARSFVALLAGLALWSVGNALQVTSHELGAKLLWRCVGYVGHNLTPIALLAFALAYTGRDRWLTRRNLALLAAEPVLVALVVTPTNALGLHDLLWSNVAVASTGSMDVLVRTFGPWYWVNTAYNYALVLVAVYLFFQLGLRSSGVARKQGFAVVAASVPAFLANVLWVAGVTPVDLTPIAFSFSAATLAVAVFRYRLFDVVPVARDSVLDDMRDAYLVVDERDRIVDLNLSARHLVDGTDPVGSPLADVLPQCADLLASHAGSLTGEASTEVAVDGIGGPRYFVARVSSLRRSGSRGRLLLLHDVTERRVTERRYRTLIESASDVVAVLDETGTFTYLSPSVERVLGYDPATLLGTAAFQYVHPDDREATRTEFERAFADPDGTTSIEHRLRHADGDWVWLESRGRNLLEDPAVEGFVVTFRDVTERTRRERQLRRQNERLEEFASVVSHDLRNPLNVIEGRIDLARETGDQAHLEDAERAADRMDDLIDELLSLARQGQVVDDPAPTSVRAVAGDAWSNVETTAGSFSFDDPDWSVRADRARLRELFENLFRNAMEHGSASPEDGPVEVHVGRLPGGFYVEDDGCGIPPDRRDRVFEDGFSTADRGTGLGLSIVRNIAEAHGWSVGVTDADRGGVRFEVRGAESTSGAADVEGGEDPENAEGTPSA